MAEPVPLPATSDTVEPITNPDSHDEELSQALREELLDEFLPNYTPKFAITANTDGLGDRLTIDINQPLPQFDTKTAKAYLVEDSANSDRKLYALICEKPLPVRKTLAKLLLKAENSALVTLVAEGIVRITSLNEERYVLIYEQPQGQTLYEIVLSQQQPFSDRYVKEKIMTPLNHALSIIEKFGYSHGKVNPHNIYIHKGRLKLGECCSEPCGYSQDFHYQPINYIQTHPAGHGGGMANVDYYAVGVIAAFMKLKPKVLRAKSREKFIKHLLQEGSYIGIAGYVDLSEEMNDLLRGTLNDTAHERWTSQQVGPWCQGKRYNLLTPTIANLGSRPFDFEGETFNNLRQLAYTLRLAWTRSIPVLQDGSLGRWVELSTRRREISEYVNITVKSYRSMTTETTNDLVTRCLFGLDRFAPVHLRSLSTQVDGTSTLIAELYHQRDDKSLNEIKEAILQSIFSAWQTSQRGNFGVIKLPTYLQQDIWLLDRARLNIRNQRLGFGVERLLYELNPSLPCLSSIVKSHYVDNVRDLLTALDHIATKEDRPTFPMDHHIAGFIGAKLSLNNTLLFNEYTLYPDLTNHKGLIALKFLQKAQVAAKGGTYPGLSAWLIATITDAIGKFHSKTIRSQFCDKLSELSREGDLSVILEYLTSYDYSTADVQGFAVANEQYANFGAKIIGLQNEELLEFRSFKLGSTIAKFVAYAIVIGMFIYYFNSD